jgi:hypothetical protein
MDPRADRRRFVAASIPFEGFDPSLSMRWVRFG